MRHIATLQLEDETVYPVEASAQGDNAYYCEFCNFGGHRPNYAACLSKIENRQQDGRLSSNDSECSVAIQRRFCQVVAMREEELEAGRAIYYVNRAKQIELNKQSLARHGVQLLDRESKSEVTYKGNFDAEAFKASVAAGRSVKPSADSMDIAAAINKKIAESVSNPDKSVVESSNKSVSADLSKDKQTTTKATFESGLSLVEIAKRMNATPRTHIF